MGTPHLPNSIAPSLTPDSYTKRSETASTLRVVAPSLTPDSYTVLCPWAWLAQVVAPSLTPDSYTHGACGNSED